MKGVYDITMLEERLPLCRNSIYAEVKSGRLKADAAH